MGSALLDVKRVLWVVWLGSFNDPPARLHLETSGAWLTLDDLELPTALLLAPGGQLFAPIGRVRPDLLKPWHQRRQPGQEFASTCWVRHIGGCDVDGDGQAKGVDQHMPFASLDAFVTVVAADTSRLLDSFHALAVHDACAWLTVASHALTLDTVERAIQQMPHAFEAKAAKMIEDCLPWWEIARQIAPGAAGAHDIEDGVEDTARVVCLVMISEVESAERRPTPRQSGHWDTSYSCRRAYDVTSCRSFSQTRSQTNACSCGSITSRQS
jgi:hypothetical protein